MKTIQVIVKTPTWFMAEQGESQPPHATSLQEYNDWSGIIHKWMICVTVPHSMKFEEDIGMVSVHLFVCPSRKGILWKIISPSQSCECLSAWRNYLFLHSRSSKTKPTTPILAEKLYATLWSLMEGFVKKDAVSWKPLVPLLGTNKALSDLPPTSDRFRMRLTWFNYQIVHVPGKHRDRWHSIMWTSVRDNWS